jgi:hypothetical protein
MPLIEKIKSEGGKSTLRSKKNPITGKEKLIWRDVEYATKESPRKVAKKTEVIDKKGTTTREVVRSEGKKSVNKYFTPKAKIEMGPLKRGGKIKKSIKKK